MAKLTLRRKEANVCVTLVGVSQNRKIGKISLIEIALERRIPTLNGAKTMHDPSEDPPRVLRSCAIS